MVLISKHPRLGQDEEAIQAWSKLFDHMMAQEISPPASNKSGDSLMIIGARDLSDELFVKVLKKFPKTYLGYQNKKKRNAFIAIYMNAFLFFLSWLSK